MKIHLSKLKRPSRASVSLDNGVDDLPELLEVLRELVARRLRAQPSDIQLDGRGSVATGIVVPA